MADQKKKKHTKLKKATVNKRRPVQKPATKTLAKKKPAPKKLAKKKPFLKKAQMKAKTERTTIDKKTAVASTAGVSRKRVPARTRTEDAEQVELQELRTRSAGQSGDLQGLSNLESADSESVDELLEEGNAFEADAVGGVESAGDADEEEVHTHEVPEDDVPGEYLDEE
jgi:N utilization substance protein A